MKIITFSVLTLYSKAIIGYGSQSIILGPVTSALPDNYQKWKFYAHPILSQKLWDCGSTSCTLICPTDGWGSKHFSAAPEKFSTS